MPNALTRAQIVRCPSCAALLRSVPSPLQACGRCCLRLAGVQQPAAYADSSIPLSAAGTLHRLQSSQTPCEGDAAAQADEQGGGKRRRLDEVGAAVAGPGAEASALGVPKDAAGAAGEEAAVVCPLCLGLLQGVAPAQGAAGSTSPLLRCSLELATTTSTLNDPQRHAASAFGTTAAATETAAAAADNEQRQGNGRGAGAGAGPPAPVVTQCTAAVPSLAAAAAAIAAEFEFDCFALEVSLPASLAVRQQALSWRLRQGEGAQGLAEALAAALGEAGRAQGDGRLASALAVHAAQAVQTCMLIGLMASRDAVRVAPCCAGGRDASAG